MIESSILTSNDCSILWFFRNCMQLTVQAMSWHVMMPPLGVDLLPWVVTVEYQARCYPTEQAQLFKNTVFNKVFKNGAAMSILAQHCWDLITKVWLWVNHPLSESASGGTCTMNNIAAKKDEVQRNTLEERQESIAQQASAAPTIQDQVSKLHLNFNSGFMAFPWKIFDGHF